MPGRRFGAESRRTPRASGRPCIAVGVGDQPEAVDPSDTETLADLIVAAIRDATNKAQAVAASKLGPLAGGLGLGGGLPF